MICKWMTACAVCDATIDVGEEVYFAPNVLEVSGKEKICQTCAHLQGYACDCGNAKKPERSTCYDCKLAQEQEGGFRCACGNYKKPQYATCYSCKNKPKEE